MERFGVHFDFKGCRTCVYRCVILMISTSLILNFLTYFLCNWLHEARSSRIVFFYFFLFVYQHFSFASVVKRYYLLLLGVRIRFQQINSLMKCVLIIRIFHLVKQFFSCFPFFFNIENGFW